MWKINNKGQIWYGFDSSGTFEKEKDYEMEPNRCFIEKTRVVELEEHELLMSFADPKEADAFARWWENNGERQFFRELDNTKAMAQVAISKLQGLSMTFPPQPIITSNGLTI